jgi:hypothetical protein
MTNEQINIAIAETCGWKLHPQDRWIVIPPNSPHSVQPLSTIPDYCNDLNAMHEAEKTLNFEQAEFFEDELCDVAKKENDVLENPLPWRFSVCHANARKRAEAFLKTIGKWEE